MPAADRPATLPEAFQRTTRIAPDAVALRTVGDGQTMTWRDYAARVRQVAAGARRPTRGSRRHRCR